MTAEKKKSIAEFIQNKTPPFSLKKKIIFNLNNVRIKFPLDKNYRFGVIVIVQCAIVYKNVGEKFNSSNIK